MHVSWLSGFVSSEVYLKGSPLTAIDSFSLWKWKTVSRRYSGENGDQSKANRADCLWQAPETPSAYIKRGEHPTRPELRDETPANGDDRVMGIKVPFVTEPIWAGTSVSEWLLLCLAPPGGFQSRTSIQALTSQRDSGAQASRQGNSPARLRRLTSPASLFVCWHTTAIRTGSDVRGGDFLACPSDLDWRAVGRVHH